MSTMNFEKMRDEAKVFYDISGRIDTQTAPDLQEEIDNCFEESEKEYGGKIELTLNFKEVEYVSSAGLRAVLYMKKKIDKMAEGSTFEIINVRPEVMDVFNMTGFSDFLTLNPT